MNSEPSCRGWVSHLCLFRFLTGGSLNYVRITLTDDEIVWNCAYGYPKKWSWQRTFQYKTPWCWAGSAFQAGLHHITSYYTNITSILWKIKAKYPKNNHVTMILIVSCLTFSASCVWVPLLARKFRWTRPPRARLPSIRRARSWARARSLPSSGIGWETMVASIKYLMILMDGDFQEPKGFYQWLQIFWTWELFNEDFQWRKGAVTTESFFIFLHLFLCFWHFLILSGAKRNW